MHKRHSESLEHHPDRGQKTEIGTLIRGLVGILIGLALAPFIFLASLVRGARAVHAHGVLCKAEIVPIDGVEPENSIGARLAGPALVRFSGAIRSEGTPHEDILGLALRLRMRRDQDSAPEVGDQDLLLGTFESFASVVFGKGKARVNSGDYLANDYDSVSPWRVGGIGVVRLRTLALPPSPGDNRLARLKAAIDTGNAELLLGYHSNDGQTGPVTPIAMVKLTSVSPLPPQQLRASLQRHGRNITAVGFRNGIRRIVYPASQLARRIRGG